VPRRFAVRKVACRYAVCDTGAVQPGAQAAKESVDAAAAAGLAYSDDLQPGIRRRRYGKGFAYFLPDGRRVSEPAVIRRIKGLAIPPAWTRVWICPDPRGHIQATGRDARGRKQYPYHAEWRSARDAAKYHRMEAFGAALPAIRAQVDRGLRRPGLPREKVLALVVRLLDQTSMRIGNDEYRRENRSFGLTTLRDRHVTFAGGRAQFLFRGKSKQQHTVRVDDRRLARLIKRCQELPGHELFQYVGDDDQRHRVESDDVNAHLRDIAGADFTAKDFRTWNDTVFALGHLRLCQPVETEKAGKQRVVEAIRQVAQHLGNTPAVCRKAYIHPAVVQGYLEGRLPDVDASLAEAALTRAPAGLSEAEQCVVALLGALAESGPAVEATCAA